MHKVSHRLCAVCLFTYYVCLLLCVSVCPRGYLRNHTRDLYQFLCMLPLSVARSSSGTLMIGCIAYRREGGDGNAQRGRNVIYDCLVFIVRYYMNLVQCIISRHLCMCDKRFHVDLCPMHQVLATPLLNHNLSSLLLCSLFNQFCSFSPTDNTTTIYSKTHMSFSCIAQQVLPA